MVPQTAHDVMLFAKEHGAQRVSLRFVDFMGRWRHFIVPLHEFHEGFFEEGLDFDGSSIKRWLDVHNSDMLEEALECLKKDHEFLLKGDVFTEDALHSWIEQKQKEVDAIRLRPHPVEYQLYFDL